MRTMMSIFFVDVPKQPKPGRLSIALRKARVKAEREKETVAHCFAIPLLVFVDASIDVAAGLTLMMKNAGVWR